MKKSLDQMEREGAVRLLDLRVLLNPDGLAVVALNVHQAVHQDHGLFLMVTATCLNALSQEQEKAVGTQQEGSVRERVEADGTTVELERSGVVPD